MPTWIVNLVVGFVIRQIKKYGESLNWAKVKADVEAQLKTLLPDWLEGAVIELALKALDILSGVITSEALKSIAEKLVSGDVAGALAELKDLIISLIAPTYPVLGAQFASAIDDHAASTAA